MLNSRLAIVMCLFAVILVHSAAVAEDVMSPEVHPDGKVTFRLFAPKATEVKADVYCGGNSALTKDDKGVWSATMGPFKPGIYIYHLLVDGMRLVDPRNKSVRSYLPPESVLVVKGNKPSLWDIRAVPHGTVHTHWYTSKVTGTERRFHVYTPPGYPAGKTTYPVFYFLHGYGDDDSSSTDHGMTNVIMDNLIADGKAKPMIIVMPYGHIVEPFVEKPNTDWDKVTADFHKDLIEGIMPIVEKTYRTKTNRENRAICGISMGGWQSLDFGFTYPDKFAWIGSFSAGSPQEIPRSTNPAEFNKRTKLLWIGCGRADWLFKDNKQLADDLTAKGIKLTWHESAGGHAWLEWRGYISDFVPLLFR